MASGLPGCELWLVDLDAADWTTESAGCLDETERARADRFHFERDRLRFIHSRTALRHVLAHHIGCRPPDVHIVIDKAGKPHLPERNALAFNLSHSGAWALIATHANTPIGIDLELPRQPSQLQGLIAQTLHLQEQAQIPQDTDAIRSAAFTRLWVRKEACLKAIGLGLQVPPQDVNVASHPPNASRGSTAVQLNAWRWQVAWSDEDLPLDCGAQASLAWLTNEEHQ